MVEMPNFCVAGSDASYIIAKGSAVPLYALLQLHDVMGFI